MIIRFGLGFDSILPETLKTCFGQVTVGPERLLSILETQLGLPIPEASQFHRLIQYRFCLKQLDSPERFYHNSFHVDQISVSRTLLSWRDQLYQAGWKGYFTVGVGKRLKGLADIEQLAANQVAPCTGQRLQAVLKALPYRKTQIDKIEIVDTISDHSHIWQQILSFFSTVELHIDNIPPKSRNKTDLERLQSALWEINRKGGLKPKQITMSKDGSVLVLIARSREISARFISEHIKTKMPGKKTLVICGDNGVLFDEALEAVDEPRCGFEATSRFTPPLQVLPMALNLIWDPVDPFLLQQFLTHSTAPIPSKIRGHLADALQKTPGIEGREWQAALDKIRSEETKDRDDDAKVERQLAAIDTWVHCRRYDPVEGAPVAEIQKRCNEVAKWLAKMQHVEKNPTVQTLYAEAFSHAKVLSDTLSSFGMADNETLDRIMLNRLLDEVIGPGIKISKHFPELNHPLVAHNPESIINRVDEIIWWDFSMPQLPSLDPWTNTERLDLEKHAVILQPPEKKLDHIAKTWLRPVMYAEKQLVLVLHQSDEEHHPLWNQIKSCVTQLPEIDVEDAIQSGLKIQGLQVMGKALEFRPLPALKRWWRLGDATLLGKRGSESYSSLDAFIKSPYQWVLKYKAKLEPGRLSALPAGNLLNGTLVHRLIEDFFKKHTDWEKTAEKEIRLWLTRSIPELLEKEGAVLLAPGRSAERDAFQAICLRALPALIKGLNSANINKVEIENLGACRFFGGELNGRIDLLLSDKSGREIVLDVKWGGRKYHEEDLRNNLHLQLAVYAWMRKSITQSSQWPPQAFFVIKDAIFLSQDQETFPIAIPCTTKNGETTPDLWRRFGITWKWRRKQIDNGLIEVTVEGTERDEKLPADGLDLPETTDKFNDYDVLTGWKEGA